MSCLDCAWYHWYVHLKEKKCATDFKMQPWDEMKDVDILYCPQIKKEVIFHDGCTEKFKQMDWVTSGLDAIA